MRKRRLSHLAAVLFLFLSSGTGNSPLRAAPTGMLSARAGYVQQAWIARHNGSGNDYDGGKAIAVDGSGNVYVTGESIRSGTGADYATFKYDSTGQQQWVAYYNGPGNSGDVPWAMAIDASGNVYVTGSSGFGPAYDYATIKYNSAGEEQWVARYNGPGKRYDVPRALAVDGSGNVYITGESDGLGNTNAYATIKYNSAGHEEWVARYNGAGNSAAASALAIDLSGNVYVTGGSAGPNGFHDYATIKYNSSGEEQWVALYSGPGNANDGAHAIALDNLDNVYVTGSSLNADNGFDYATIKYNSVGEEQWVARYGGPGVDNNIESIVLDESSNVYVTGTSSGSVNNADYVTIKYDTSGTEEWVARFDGPAHASDSARGIALDGSGNVYVTGTSYTPQGSSYDYATIKYNSSGEQVWVARYNGPGNEPDEAKAIAVDDSGNVYVTGDSADLGFNSDFATIKYVQTSDPPPTPVPTPSPSATSTPPPPTPTPSVTPAATATPTPTATPGNTSQAVNLSTRMRVQTGGNVGIGGFIITGSGTKHLLVRAIGPSLSQFGVPSPLPDPVLELHGPGAFVTINNDNWQDDPVQKALIEATGLQPTNDLEAAIEVRLPSGAYTAVVRGKNNTTGVGLIEVYDLDPSASSKLGNLSTRALVSTGNDIVIAGFILAGNSSYDRVILRGIGPSLAALQGPELDDPTLELRDNNGALLAANNDWEDDPTQAAELVSAGLAPSHHLEPGIAATLPPGLYTALLAGLNNGTGIGVIEVYDRGP
jgi:hypothetical protein